MALLSDEDQRKLVKMYSALRKQMKDLDSKTKADLIREYVSKDFKEDIANFTAIAVKLYTYLGYNYFTQTMAETTRMIEVYEELGKYPIT